jgi:hypothetical protein
MQISVQFLNGWRLRVSAEAAAHFAGLTMRPGTLHAADHGQHSTRHVAGPFDICRDTRSRGVSMGLDKRHAPLAFAVAR